MINLKSYEIDQLAQSVIKRYKEYTQTDWELCPPRKNRQKTYAKNRMKRMTNII